MHLHFNDTESTYLVVIMIDDSSSSSSHRYQTDFIVVQLQSYLNLFLND